MFSRRASLAIALCVGTPAAVVAQSVDSAAVQLAAASKVVAQSMSQSASQNASQQTTAEHVLFDRKVLRFEPNAGRTGERPHTAAFIAGVERETSWRVGEYRDAVQCDSMPRQRCHMVNTDLYVAVSDVEVDGRTATVSVITYMPTSGRTLFYGVGYRVRLRLERGRWIVDSVNKVWQS